MRKRRTLTWVQLHVHLRTYRGAFWDALKQRSRTFLFVMFMLSLIFALVLTMGFASSDVARSNIPRYKPTCTHGGKLLDSAWYHRPYCVTFVADALPPASSSGNSTNSSAAGAAGAAGAGEQDAYAFATEWGSSVKGYYPADMPRDYTPRANEYFADPVFAVVVSVLLLLPALGVGGYAIADFMAELESNYARLKRGYEDANGGKIPRAVQAADDGA